MQIGLTIAMNATSWNAITVMQEQREDWIIIFIKKCSVEIWHSGINESKIFIQCNLAQIIVQNIDTQTQNSPLLSQIAKYLSVECLELWKNLRGGGGYYIIIDALQSLPLTAHVIKRSVDNKSPSRSTFIMH